jgi:predicted GNAT family acetyltransferase
MVGMAPEVKDNTALHRFEIHVDGALAGFAAYHRNGAAVTMTHTEIDSAYEGKGLGSVLARHALDALRAEGAALIPVCPFIRGYVQRHPEYQDLVPADQRARFGLS